MILLTGGLGYIGSHMAAVLLDAGYQVVIVDSLINSTTQVLERLQQFSKKNLDIVFYQTDVRDTDRLTAILQQHQIRTVYHFAALKSPAESVQQPLMYFDVNVRGTISVLQAMKNAQVYQLIFSSSAAVYGTPQQLPAQENHSTSPLNPYGMSKWVVEELLQSTVFSSNLWKVGVLRYFNPAGAHSSGLLGEQPQGLPNNLIPYIAKVALGELPCVHVFGNDYATPDGTGIRDYIHVMDLVRGHLCLMHWLGQRSGAVFEVFNLGLGRGYSVLAVLEAFERATGVAIPYRIMPRRAGDAAEVFADVSKAHRWLGWQAQYHLDDMVQDMWTFIQQQYCSPRIIPK